MTKILHIEGMSCQHCVRHVTDAIKELAGVADVVVNLEEKTAIVQMVEPVGDDLLKSALEEAGYELVGVR